MGVVIYRRVINVYEIPRDILVECIGRGLKINREDEDIPCLLEVAAGSGLKYEESGEVAVDIGNGLKLSDNKVEVDLSGFVGGGLKQEESGKVSVDIGDGLKLSDNKIKVDLEVISDGAIDPTKTKVLTVLVDSNIAFEAGKLTLTRHYHQFSLLKNCHGQMLDIVATDHITSKEEVMIGGVCYGYGYGYGSVMKSLRESTIEMPNFYKK